MGLLGGVESAPSSARWLRQRSQTAHQSQRAQPDSRVLRPAHRGSRLTSDSVAVETRVPEFTAFVARSLSGMI